MMTGAFAAAEEIQLLLPENQPDARSRFGARGALMVGAAVLLVAVPLGLSRVGAGRRSAEAASPPTATPIRARA